MDNRFYEQDREETEATRNEIVELTPEQMAEVGGGTPPDPCHKLG